LAKDLDTRASSKPSSRIIADSHVAGPVPRRGRRRHEPTHSFVYAEDVTLQRPPVLGVLDAGAQLLSHDDAEILERRAYAMEVLKGLVRDGIAKGVDEQLRVQDVFSRRSPPCSGELTSTTSTQDAKKGQERSRWLVTAR
jgi:hypothetical protein